jgi:hypothetical protein
VVISSHEDFAVDGPLDVGFHVSRLLHDIAAAMTFLQDLHGIWPESLLTYVATLSLVSGSGNWVVTT